MEISGYGLLKLQRVAQRPSVTVCRPESNSSHYICCRLCWIFSNYWNFLCLQCFDTCWLGCRKGIRPVKNWVVGCWCGYLSGAMCRFAQLMPLPLTFSCFSKFPTGFTFLVPAHLGTPGQRAIKRACVCVYWNFFNLRLCGKFTTKPSLKILCIWNVSLH